MTNPTDQELLDFAKSQRDLCYAQFKFYRENEIKIRNWCITLVLGLIAYTASQSHPLSIEKGIGIMLVPVILCWLQEGVQMFLSSHCIAQAKKMNGFLLGQQEMDAGKLYSNSLENAYSSITFQSKVRGIFKSLRAKTTSLFYLLIMASVIILRCTLN